MRSAHDSYYLNGEECQAALRGIFFLSLFNVCTLGDCIVLHGSCRAQSWACCPITLSSSPLNSCIHGVNPWLERAKSNDHSLFCPDGPTALAWYQVDPSVKQLMRRRLVQSSASQLGVAGNR